jgi:hypothetical protein
VITTIDPRVVLDHCITIRLLALERQVRADLEQTGPEAEADLDVPPDLDADWQRVSVEEVLVLERTRLERWRDRLLEAFV